VTRHRVAAIGVATSLVVAGVVVLASGGGSRANATPRSQRTVSHATTAPHATSDGFSHDERGARRAAITYATSSERWLYLDDGAITRAMHAIATRRSAERLTANVLDEVRATREALLGAPRTWWIVRPLASRVTATDARRAEVEVWVVTVLSATEVAEPQADWRTITLELRWERADWRVADVADSAGPTPAEGPRDRPWTAARLDRALEGFVRAGIDA